MKITKDLRLKWDKFKRDRRAFISFILLLTLFILTSPAEFLCNTRPIILSVEGKIFVPVLFTYSEKDFGGTLLSEPDYLSKKFKNLLNGIEDTSYYNSIDYSKSTTFNINLNDFEEKESIFSIETDDFEDELNERQVSPKKNSSILKGSKKPLDYWVLWPPVRYDYMYIPTESKTGNVVLAAPYKIIDKETGQVTKSSWVDGHYLGTDDRGRDVLARLIYGLRISMVFGISIALAGTIIGCLLGGVQGYFGGWIDLIGQRLTEVWGSIPRLYILIILSSFLVPSALLLFLILNLTAWMGIAAYIRAEFLKIRNFEYVKSAKAMGVSNFRIMRKHILPNALTPVITFFPFEVTAGILALVSLDFLNLGVPSPAPSIGELLAQGKTNLQATWILLPTFITLTATLTMLTFVGEGIRNAFDPKRNN
jgi:microcin C transport system permease protein